MKIKIDNRTHHDTAMLRALLRRCFAAVGIPNKRRHGAVATLASREIVVEVRRHLSGNPEYTSGRAVLGRSPIRHGRWMKLGLPRVVSYRQLTWLMTHEALHLVGIEHKDMTRAQMNCTRTPEWALPEPCELVHEREKVAASKPAPEAKLAHAREKLAQALTRERRATTFRKKWALKVKIWERKVGAT
jgi:hypothetical protein